MSLFTVGYDVSVFPLAISCLNNTKGAVKFFLLIGHFSTYIIYNTT